MRQLVYLYRFIRIHLHSNIFLCSRILFLSLVLDRILFFLLFKWFYSESSYVTFSRIELNWVQRTTQFWIIFTRGYHLLSCHFSTLLANMQLFPPYKSILSFKHEATKKISTHNARHQKIALCLRFKQSMHLLLKSNHNHIKSMWQTIVILPCPFIKGLFGKPLNDSIRRLLLNQSDLERLVHYFSIFEWVNKALIQSDLREVLKEKNRLCLLFSLIKQHSPSSFSYTSILILRTPPPPPLSDIACVVTSHGSYPIILNEVSSLTLYIDCFCMYFVFICNCDSCLHQQ